jgi:hypothetical protein
MSSFGQADWESGAPRRILGLKIWQAALLLGMAVMDCLVVVAGIVIVAGSVPPAAVAKPSRTSTPEPAAAGSASAPAPSATPLTMMFQFPTYTPYGTPADTSTLTPTVTEFTEGWVKFSVTELEIWMPPTFAGGDPHTEAEAIIASLKQMGAEFDWDAIEESLTNSDEHYIFWGIDSYQGNPGAVSNVAIFYDFPNPGESLAEYTTRVISANSDVFILVEQKIVHHPVYEVERVILDTKESLGASTRLALYIVRDGNVVWGIQCDTSVEEMPARLPAFDHMVDSFRVLAPPQ